MVSSRVLLEYKERLVAQRTVRPLLVVVTTPVVDDGAGIVQILEPRLIQTTVAKASIERLDKRVWGRLTGLDEQPLHLPLPAKEEHRLAGYLRAMVQHQAYRQSTALLKLSRYPAIRAPEIDVSTS